MFSKLRNEISAHKVRYSVISAVLVLAVVLFALFGVSYIRRHFRTVNIDREQATRTEQIDMKEKSPLRLLMQCKYRSHFLVLRHNIV